jgi:hypothetical protein
MASPDCRIALRSSNLRELLHAKVVSDKFIQPAFLNFASY